MDKRISSSSIDSNARPYGIFVAYMLTCLAVAVFIISKLIARARSLRAFRPSQSPQKRHVALFAVLAALSLLSTWSFMFQYFQWSYDNWLTVRSQHDLDPSIKHWGLWLKETSLFREAWENVIVGHNRYWWSHQIFYFACALGLHSEWKGIRRGITFTWSFMLLGQIVAISFATNLYFLALLLSPSQQKPVPPQSSKGVGSESYKSASVSKSRIRLGLWLINGVSVVMTSAAADLLSREKYRNGPGFMPLLLLPHAILLVLPAMRAFIPSRFFPLEEEEMEDKIYKFLWILNSHFVGRLVWTTYQAYVAGNLEYICNTLLEHPAVSSVGFDVIFCWISWLCWWQTQSDSLSF